MTNIFNLDKESLSLIDKILKTAKDKAFKEGDRVGFIRGRESGFNYGKRLLREVLEQEQNHSSKMMDNLQMRYDIISEKLERAERTVRRYRKRYGRL